MEEALIRKAREGDAEAFLTLVRRYDRQIMSVVYRMSGDVYDREDLYQEVFLHCFKAIKSYRARSSFRTWLYRVALNRCIDYMKKKPAIREVEDSVVPPEDWERREKVRAVLKALSRLKGPQRICFFLYYVEGWEIRDIQELSGLREGTVKSHLNRARQKIRKDREVLLWQMSPS